MFIDLKKEREREKLMIFCLFFFNFRNAGTAANAMCTKHIPHPQGLISSFWRILFVFLSETQSPIYFQNKSMQSRQCP